MDKIKLPTSFRGIDGRVIDGKEAYNRVVNSPDAPNNQINPVIIPHIPNQDLQFIKDENLYQEIIKYLDKTFPDHSEVLNDKISFGDNAMRGSNPYIAVAVDMFLKSISSEYRIARQTDLETNLQMFNETYEDTGLVLRSLKEPNKIQAEYLYNQLQKRNHNIKFPIWFDIRGLTLDNRLNFNLTDGSRYKTAECLNWEMGTHYLKTDDFGLPKSKDKDSGRQIWTIKDGLSVACLLKSLDLGSSDSSLSYSNDYGRVVLAKPRSG